MKLGLISAFVCAAAVGVAGQSARIKPSPTPTPNPNLRPSVVFNPTARAETPRPRTSPSPTPTPKSGDEADVVKVESALVPIPISVIDSGGRAMTNLRLEDFDLKIDGQPAQISQVSRSESPIRLAMLFDNSSSVAIARER